MLLKRIELTGFKSFADKTVFSFGPGILGVVGPNGSGKSNLVDAVKWVLGEQKVKTLRAGESTDVIFSGNDHRRALSMAEVSIVFDNNLRSFVPEGDEVTISRRLYRDGSSEYLLNSKKVRLKDIRETILGTGLGVNEYSIIEQGKVDTLIQLSPKARRALFDEAAGILRYKEKRDESIRRLERVQQNLDRLADILIEVSRQKRSLQIQATKARRFVQLKEQLDKAKLDLLVLRFRVLTGSHSRLEEKLLQVETSYAQSLALFGKLSAEREQKSVYESSHRENVSEIANEIIRYEGILAKQENEIQWCDRRAKELASRLERTRNEAGTLQNTLKDKRDELASSRQQEVSLKEAMESRQKVVQGIREDINSLEPSFSEIRTELRIVETRRDESRRKRLDYERSLAKAQARVEKLEEQNHWFSSEIEKAGQKVAELDREIEGIETSSHTMSTDLKKLVEEEKEASTTLSHYDEKISQLRDKTNEIRGELSVASSRLRHLTELENREKKGSKVELREVFSDRISVSEGWEVATETLMGAFLKAGLYSGDSEPGRGFWILPSREDIIRFSGSFPGAVPATDVIECKGSFKGAFCELANSVFFVEEIPSDVKLKGGIKLIDKKGSLRTQYTFVKPQGKSSSEESTLLRKNEIRKLSAKVADLQARESEVRAELSETQNKRNTQVTAISEIVKGRRRLEVNVQLKNGKRSSIKHEQGSIRQSRENFIQRQKANQEEIERQKISLAEMSSIARGDESADADFENRIVELRRKIGSLNRDKDELNRRLSDARISAATSAEKHASTISRIRNLEREVADIDRRISGSGSDLEGISEQLENSKKTRANMASQTVDTSERITKLRARHQETAQELANLEAARKGLDSRVQETEKKLEEERKTRESLKIDVNQVQARISALEERCTDELGIPLADENQIRSIQTESEEELATIIEDCTTKLEPIRNVNLEAVNLLDEVEKRHVFLEEQEKDLKESKGSLEELITEINDKCRTLFTETFEMTRANFNEIFRKLFGGGRAEITLEDGDILEAGVQINVRPPGKDPRAITLLSGGEKALTAISLLLAMFRANPSPFCILDEVDAPLDDANIERFVSLLREFTDRSQFILISHSKRTIERIDGIYGITIDKEGVSRSISVKLEKVEALLNK